MLPLESKNVLLCLRYGIGDVIMDLPGLSALRDALPHARITALGNPPAHELLEGDPRVDAVVSTEWWGLRHRWDAGDPETRAAIKDWVREERFDLVLDAAQATLAVGEAVWALGYRSLEADSAEERRTLEAGAGGVEAIRAGVRAGWGIEVPADRPPELNPRTEDRWSADRLLQRYGLGAERPFAISPVASMPLKRWPLERFSAVADHVIAQRGGPVLVLEGPQAGAGEAVVEAMRSPESAIRVGPLHLLRTAELLRRCAGLVCNDTGIMHIAAAVGTPTVAVFGPTRSDYFLPPRPGSVGVEPPDLECSYRETRSLHPPECWRRGECLIAHHPCTVRTRSADVIAAVEALLHQTGQRRRPAAPERACWSGAAVSGR